MKRIVLLGLALFAFVAPAGAHAAVPCRDKIYNDWYASGKISTSYPKSCYQDALKHVPSDAQVYSNLSGDIKRALQAAIARHDHPGGSGGAGIPAAVGSGPGSVGGADGPHDVKGRTQTGTNSVAAAPLSGSSGGGIPTPILVLGAIAILLALAGLTGTGVQWARKRRAV